MSQLVYRYLIVGGGLAGASAIAGIREEDSTGTICLLSSERDLPYDRPPLSKKLWTGDKQVKEIFLQDSTYYDENNVELKLGVVAIALDREHKIVIDAAGKEYHYERLLLATGGTPRRLTIPGHDLNDLCYFRSLPDYKSIRAKAIEGASAVIIGGGFIGSELAAALRTNKLNVTMVFPEDNICQKVIPQPLAKEIQSDYVRRGIVILNEDLPIAILERNGRFLTHTKKGSEIRSDIVIAGIGIHPNMKLAAAAGLEVANGISVNEYLQTTDPDIYAAGDNAYFPCKALEEKARFEHWDNALNQGKHAGRNMAGAAEPYEYLSYFFSDLFDFGYEAVGDVSTKLKTSADWQEVNRKGTIYYLEEDVIRGVMFCNLWDKVDEARQWITNRTNIRDLSLKAANR